MNLEMDFELAYRLMYQAALVWFAVLITFMLIRSILGPRITDRILSINMIGTMVICCLGILSVFLEEPYLVDVALLYAMISFVSVLIFATIYIPAKPPRGKFLKDVHEEVREEHRYLIQMRRMLSDTEEDDTAAGQAGRKTETETARITGTEAAGKTAKKAVRKTAAERKPEAKPAADEKGGTVV